MSETVALNKKRQSKFAKKAAKVKSKVQKGEIKVKDDVAPEGIKKKTKPQRGLIYIGHIPHGFYETEMRSYFSQFGKITNVRVCRSYKTGKSKGFGYVEFLLPEVAEVAAQTMDNYLMFKRRLEVKYIPPEKQQQNVFRGRNWSVKQTPYTRAVKRATHLRNANHDEETHVKKVKQQLTKLQKTMKKLNALGIVHEVQPQDIPADLTLSSLEKTQTGKRKIGVAKKPAPKKVSLKSSSNQDTSMEKSQKSKIKVKSAEVPEKKKNIKAKKESKKSVQTSESEPDVSFDELPKKKKIIQKSLTIVKSKKAPVKKMSNKLKKATMDILSNSDFVVKAGKVSKKTIKKK